MITDTADDTEAQGAPPRGLSAKRASILGAAESIFCRDGFAAANIDVIALEAGVSRQTIYNHHGDKEGLFIAVVSHATDRANAGFFAALARFPDHPSDLKGELTAFAIGMMRNCLCSRDGRFLRKMIVLEGRRYPELFTDWRQNGPTMVWNALAARFARLAFSGWLTLDDPDVAARQFMALINADLYLSVALGEPVTDDALRQAAGHAVDTFLRAFGRRTSATE